MSNDTWKLKILFDGACPICSTEMKYLKKRDIHNLIALEDITNLTLDPATYNKTKEDLNKYIHAITPTGEIIKGVEVFRQAYQLVGLGFILWPTRLPIIKQIADLAYSIFAKYRLPISRLLGRKEGHSCEL